MWAWWIIYQLLCNTQALELHVKFFVVILSWVLDNDQISVQLCKFTVALTELKILNSDSWVELLGPPSYQVTTDLHLQVYLGKTTWNIDISAAWKRTRGPWKVGLQVVLNFHFRQGVKVKNVLCLLFFFFSPSQFGLCGWSSGTLTCSRWLWGAHPKLLQRGSC